MFYKVIKFPAIYPDYHREGLGVLQQLVLGSQSAKNPSKKDCAFDQFSRLMQYFTFGVSISP